MKKLHTEEVDTLCKAILSLETVEECYNFFEDICTVKEIIDIAQRLKAARMLKDGANYTQIAEATGMSTATISRVNKCLEYGNGGYKIVLDRLQEEQKTMLYRVEEGCLKELKNLNFVLEKDLQKFVEKNMDTLIGYRFLETEFVANNYPILYNNVRRC